MLEHWRRASLRVHLLVQLFVALAAIFIVFLYISVQALNASIQDTLQERAVLARLMADRVDAQLDYAMRVLQSALPAEELNLADNNLAPEKRLLQDLYDHSILFKRVYLLDASGNALWMAPLDEQRIGINVTAPPYNRAVADVHQPTFFATIGRQSKTPGVVLIVPVPDSHGDNVRFLLGWIDFGDPRASSLLYPYEPGGGGYTDLVDDKGLVLASTNPERVAQSSDHAGHFAALIQNNQVSVGTCHSCHTSDGVGRQNDVMAFAPLTHVPWGLALGQPESEAFANTNALTLRLGAVGLVVLLVFLGLVWATTRDTVQPIKTLTQACQQIAAGDLSHPIPPTGTAETATLARSFEGMRQDLLRYQERMAASQRDLENRVEERTAELVKYRDYLVKTNRNLTALNAVSATLVHRLDLGRTLDVVLERVLEAMAADAAGIFFLDERETAFVLAAHRGLSADMLPSINRLSRADLLCSGECESQLDHSAWRTPCRQALGQHFKSSSILTAPLEEKGKLLGCLFVTTSLPAHFTSEDDALLNSIGWQIAMGVRNARLYEAVQRKEKEHAEMLHQVIAAQEEERKRIARELHDETSQGLATLMLGLDTLDAALGVDPREAAALQETNKAIARQMLENIRRITTDLRPSLLDDLGLVPAVALYGEKRLSPLGITLRLEGTDVEDHRLSPDLEIALFRIIQEAITNVIRHAHATTVTVQLAHEDGNVEVRVSDDGQGFDLQAFQSIDAQGRGLGLHGMRERAGLLGGEFHIQTSPGRGTNIIVRVPRPKE